MESPQILLTNDDGIDAPGLAAMYNVLTELGDVHVVAPAGEQSAMGRALSFGRGAAMHDHNDVSITTKDGTYGYEVPASEHELGYALAGTPCDCAVAGVCGFDLQPDLVVSGCNSGPNLGEGVFGRSGTVSAAMEAAYLGVPSIAISSDVRETGEGYGNAAATLEQIVTNVLAAGLGEADYLNVNVPATDDPDVSLTRPCPAYEMGAELNDDSFRLSTPLLGGETRDRIDEDANTDRAAFLARNETSVTPLKLPYTPTTIDRFLEKYGDDEYDTQPAIGTGD